MKRRWSFRGRLLAGAAAWSIGLLILASMALAHSVDHSPNARYVVHQALQNPVAMLLTAGCLLLGVWQVKRALLGIDRIRSSMASLHSGASTRLSGPFPSEVQPLVDDVNTLLDTRDSTAERALATAGNLAHGLKTPLAVLTNEAERVRARGAPDVADAIEQQVSRMRRQVDYHLARARATSSPLPGARTALRESLDGLVRVLLRLHDTRDLSIEVDVNPEIDVEVLRSDADDILGNLLDNACRWARSHIQVQASVREGRVEVSVDDDGPGVPPELWDAVLQRGVRADESGSSGLGLAIARELIELYGGSIVLGPSPLGGLRVSVQLIHRS